MMVVSHNHKSRYGDCFTPDRLGVAININMFMSFGKISTNENTIYLIDMAENSPNQPDYIITKVKTYSQEKERLSTIVKDKIKILKVDKNFGRY